MTSHPSDDDSFPDAALAVRDKPRAQRPSMYKVYLLNDDYTPMEFVVAILENIFRKTRQEATHIMLLVHHKGAGLCGVYSFDVAETKATQVETAAATQGYPLRCKLEKA